MLRWDYSSDRSYPPVPSVVRCDVETGRILSEGALPFPAMALAVSSSSDSLLIVVVPPAPHDSMPRPVRQAPDERLPLRRHVLRMARLRLPDWAVEAETEVEIKYSGSSYELGYSLRVVAMPSRRAWVVGIDGPDEDEYRVSFRDEKTLAEIASCSVPSQLHSRYRGIALDTGNPSRVLIGLQDWDGYRWDSWDTDSGEVTFTKVPLGNGLPSRTGPGWDFGVLGFPTALVYQSLS